VKTKNWCAILIILFGARMGWGATVRADQFPGTDAGAKISAAIEAAGNFGVVDARGLGPTSTAEGDLVISKRVLILLPCGSITFAPGKGIKIAVTGVTLLGCGPTLTVLRSDGTSGDFISNPDAPRTTYSFTRIENLDIQTISTRASGALLNATNLDQGLMRNVRILGNWWDVFDHFGAHSGIWNYNNIRVPGGQTVNRILFMQSPAGTVSGIFVTDAIVSNTLTYHTAAVDLDSGTDGVIFNGAGFGPVWVHNSIRTGRPPDFIQFNNSEIEGTFGAYNAIKIDSCNGFSYSNGYIASSLNAVQINGGSDIKITYNTIINVQHRALDLVGGTGVLFQGNRVTGVSQAGTLIDSAVNVTANVSDFAILDNYLRTGAYSRRALRGVTLEAGKSDRYRISRNDWGMAGIDFGARGDNPFSDLSTGNSVVRGNDLPGFLVRGGRPIAHNGTGSEATVLSWTLPGGTLGPRDGLHYLFGGSAAGTASSHTITLYFGTTQVGQVTIGPAAESWTIETWVFNSNTMTNQDFSSVAIHGVPNKDGATVRTYSSGTAQNTAADVPLKVTCSTGSGNQIIIRTYSIDTVRR
jgi:hypothetical protein